MSKKIIITIILIVIIILFGIYKWYKNQPLDNEKQKNFFDAIVKHDFIYVNKILDDEDNINNYRKFDFLPLLTATSEGKLDMMKLLIDRGADANGTDKDGISPIMYARTPDKILLLLKHGAKVNQTDNLGDSVLHNIAAEKNKTNILKILIHNGANVNLKNKNGWTPVVRAVQHDCFDNVKLLIYKKANININDNYNDNLLWFNAFMGKDSTITQFLIDKGLKVNQKNKIGQTPLIIASKSQTPDNPDNISDDNKLSIIKCLLKNGSDINAQDDKGYTALHWAVYNNTYFRVKLLLDHGANKSVKNKEEETPLDLAVKKKYNKIAELLRK